MDDDDRVRVEHAIAGGGTHPARRPSRGTAIFTTSEAPGAVLDSLRALLDEAFEGDFSEDDWHHTIGGWHVVVMDESAPVSHAAVVPRTLEIAGRPFQSGYVEGVATAPARQREGLGSIVMSRVARLLRAEFQVGALSTGRHGFYERLGWERWRGHAFVRRGGALVRTEEDDDGLMVLRFGHSLAVDLAAPICCEGRTGDDW